MFKMRTRRWLLMITLIFTCVVAAAIATVFLPTQYEAKAIILIKAPLTQQETRPAPDVENYQILAKSPVLLAKLLDEVSIKDMDMGKLQRLIKVGVERAEISGMMETTSTLSLAVITDDKENSQAIANKWAHLFVRYIDDLTKDRAIANIYTLDESFLIVAEFYSKAHKLYGISPSPSIQLKSTSSASLTINREGTDYLSDLYDTRLNIQLVMDRLGRIQNSGGSESMEMKKTQKDLIELQAKEKRLMSVMEEIKKDISNLQKSIKSTAMGKSIDIISDGKTARKVGPFLMRNILIAGIIGTLASILLMVEMRRSDD